MKISTCLLYLFASCDSLFTNDIVVELTNDDENFARDFGDKHGLTFKRRVFENHFHFVHPRVRRRSAQPFQNASPLQEDASVVWFEQQRVKSRTKRDYVMEDESRTKRDYVMEDPLYKDMWYINPEYERRNDKETRHMNVTAAWALGYTGKGIVVSILDDGIEMTHPDLSENYDAAASYDVNSDDDDPTPHYNSRNDKLELHKDSSYTNGVSDPPITDFLRGYTKEINRHGTRCAGEVAATANNHVCVPGIAYKSKVGGVRMLDGDVTDLVEARSIGHNQEHVDIYSASWGPDDDGRTVDGPAKLAIKEKVTIFHPIIITI